MTTIKNSRFIESTDYSINSNYDYHSSNRLQFSKALSEAKNQLQDFNGRKKPELPTPNITVLESFLYSVWSTLPLSNFIPPPLHGFYRGMTISDPATGIYGAAYESLGGKIAITFSGTTPTHPFHVVAMLNGDEDMIKNKVIPAQKQAAQFTESVVSQALADGYDIRNISINGISFGGGLAAYAAQQTGVGGIGIVSPGIPVDPDAASGRNFLNLTQRGDPFSQHDVKTDETPGVSKKDSRGNDVTHYGKTIVSGSPVATRILERSVETFLGSQAPGTDAIGDLFRTGGIVLAPWALDRISLHPDNGEVAQNVVGLLGTAGSFYVNHVLGIVAAPLTMGGRSLRELTSDPQEEQWQVPIPLVANA